MSSGRVESVFEAQDTRVAEEEMPDAEDLHRVVVSRLLGDAGLDLREYFEVCVQEGSAGRMPDVTALRLGRTIDRLTEQAMGDLRAQRRAGTGG